MTTVSLESLWVMAVPARSAPYTVQAALATYTFASLSFRSLLSDYPLYCTCFVFSSLFQ